MKDNNSNLYLDSQDIEASLASAPGCFFDRETVTGVFEYIEDGEVSDILVTESSRPFSVGAEFFWIYKEGKPVPFVEQDYVKLDEAQRIIELRDATMMVMG